MSKGYIIDTDLPHKIPTFCSDLVIEIKILSDKIDNTTDFRTKNLLRLKRRTRAEQAVRLYCRNCEYDISNKSMKENMLKIFELADLPPEDLSRFIRSFINSKYDSVCNISI